MWTVKNLEATRSTQDVALKHVRYEYNNEKLVFYSENQTHGYGTNGRPWISSDRSLAASMVFPLNILIKDNTPKLLPIIFALLVAKILENAMSPKRITLGIKWPNDLYKDGKKVGGILLHLISTKREKSWSKIAILGIGINIAWRDNNRFNASALYDCIERSKTFDALRFFQELTTGIDNLDDDIIFLNPPLEFNKRDILKKKYIKVAINKYQMVSGINEGIDLHGKLLIKETSRSELTKIDRGTIQWR
ncbi:biotin--[acetyl-CoA-carboxylase] ligase [Betaproteobacteria bacterium]|nr:biotin--[acetyl-CoA-carboxylase] ligase [Betaproteobacteria bacterium]